jgi:hypothetical protein
MRRGVGIAAVLLWAGAAEARGTCVIEGKKTAPIVVEVAPREASPFKLRVDGLPVAVETGGLEQPATVHVKGALVFDGHAQAADIPARTKRSVESVSGMVTLAAATDKLTVHAALRANRADVNVRLPGVELRGVILPCDALTLDDVNPPKPTLEDDGSSRVVPTGKLVHLRNAAGKGEAMEIAVEDPSDLELKRVEEQGSWLRVTSRWADGTMIHGWVPKSEVQAAGTHHERIGDLSPLASVGCSELPLTATNERIAPAHVAVGTQVFAARYLGAWAKVADGSKLTVRFRPKDDWVEIVKVPGLASVTSCAGNTTVVVDAWIPRAAAKLPADAAPTDGGAPAH